MQIFRLIKTTPFVPGEYPYEQRERYENGAWVGNVVTSWPANGLGLEEQARSNVLPFRKKNGFARATLAEAVDDINIFTCARLNNSTRYCSDGSPQVRVQTSAAGCGSCGAAIT